MKIGRKVFFIIIFCVTVTRLLIYFLCERPFNLESLYNFLPGPGHTIRLDACISFQVFSFNLKKNYKQAHNYEIDYEIEITKMNARSQNWKGTGKVNLKTVEKLELGELYETCGELSCSHSVQKFFNLDWDTNVMCRLDRISIIKNRYIQKGYFEKIEWQVKRKILKTREYILGKILERNDRFDSTWMALILGNQSFVSAYDRELYCDFGFFHVIVISGSHIYLLYIFLIWLFKRIFGVFALYDYNITIQVTYPFILLVIYIYCSFIESSVPTNRALIFITIDLMLSFLGLYLGLFERMLFSVLFVIFIYPESMADISFYLVCSALLGIFCCNYLGTFKAGVTGYVAFCIIMFLSTAPMISYFFYTVPVFSVFANLLVVPLFSFVLIPITYLVFWGFTLFGIDLSWMLSVCSKILYFIFQQLESYNGQVPVTISFHMRYISIILVYYLILMGLAVAYVRFSRGKMNFVG